MRGGVWWRLDSGGGGLIPRHGRSGWQRMWPNRAFDDGNILPHSLQGWVILGAFGSGFFVYLGFLEWLPELPPPSPPTMAFMFWGLILFVRFFLGFWCFGCGRTVVVGRKISWASGDGWRSWESDEVLLVMPLRKKKEKVDETDDWVLKRRWQRLHIVCVWERDGGKAVIFGYVMFIYLWVWLNKNSLIQYSVQVFQH